MKATVCLLVLALSALASAQQQLPLIQHSGRVPLTQSQTACSACSAWPELLRQAVAASSDRPVRAGSAEREQIAAALVPEALPFAANMTSTVCGAVTGCSSGIQSMLQADPSKSAAENTLICSACEMMVANVLRTLQDPNTQSSILAAGHEACNRLAPSLRPRCLEYVDEIALQAFAFIKDVDAPLVCEATGACPKLGRSFRPMPVSMARLQALAANVTARVSQQLSQVSKQVSAAESTLANETCKMCEEMVQEIAAILRDPSTQLEILSYVKQVCSLLKALHDECVMYVDLYGPIIFNVIEQYLQPGPICQRTGFCHVALT